MLTSSLSVTVSRVCSADLDSVKRNFAYEDSADVLDDDYRTDQQLKGDIQKLEYENKLKNENERVHRNLDILEGI